MVWKVGGGIFMFAEHGEEVKMELRKWEERSESLQLLFASTFLFR